MVGKTVSFSHQEALHLLRDLARFVDGRLLQGEAIHPSGSGTLFEKTENCVANDIILVECLHNINYQTFPQSR